MNSGDSHFLPAGIAVTPLSEVRDAPPVLELWPTRGGSLPIELPPDLRVRSEYPFLDRRFSAFDGTGAVDSVRVTAAASVSSSEAASGAFLSRHCSRTPSVAGSDRRTTADSQVFRLLRSLAGSQYIRIHCADPSTCSDLGWCRYLIRPPRFMAIFRSPPHCSHGRTRTPTISSSMTA